jgi:hypothetical protein
MARACAFFPPDELAISQFNWDRRKIIQPIGERYVVKRIQRSLYFYPKLARSRRSPSLMFCKTLYGVDKRVRRSGNASNDLHRQLDEHPNGRGGGDDFRRGNETLHSALHTWSARRLCAGRHSAALSERILGTLSAHFKHARVSARLPQCCWSFRAWGECVRRTAPLQLFARISVRNRFATISTAAATAGDIGAQISNVPPSIA